jgi:hypothetical protein
MTFEEWLTFPSRSRYDVICCGVDSLSTMAAVARFGLSKNIPVIFTNVSADCEAARIFIQRPGPSEACFGCYKPDLLGLDATRQPCTPVAACGDILRIAIGFGARAAFAELLGQPMASYNCRDITFMGIAFAKHVQKKECCDICRPTLTVI